MKTPLVEIDGDEMTRILWQWVKEILIAPYVDLKTEYYDLGLKNRDQTEDQVTVDAANAIRKYGVGVKCATITANAQRVDEYKLAQMWKSPNATLRAILDGTVFRAPIVVKGITPVVKSWIKPITIARHAYGDIYKCSEAVVGKGKAEIVFTAENGEVTRLPIHDYKGPGVVMGMHNTDESISSFARACFEFGLSTKQDVWFGAKDTISKQYDHHFKDIFADIYANEYEAKYKNAGIVYFYTLIDDIVARVMRSKGGFIWACKNYDGDVMSDMLASAYGSLSMMTSVLVAPDGATEYEASHGTVTQHYYRYLKGEDVTTNPIATLFAWTGGMKRRGVMDGNADLTAFAQRVEDATIATVESGVMTKDLIPLFAGEARAVNCRGFLGAIADKL